MKYLIDIEQRQLLRILRDSRSSRRDLMIIELVLHTGLRLRELRMLNVGDVFNGTYVRSHLIVRAETAKRCKSREIFLNSYISKRLRHFITYKNGKGESLESTASLFISKKGNRLGQRSIQDLAEKWFMRADLTDAKGKSRFTFHSLRHTFALNLRSRKINLERIQKLLGHKSLQATGIYLEPSREELAEATQTLAA